MNKKLVLFLIAGILAIGAKAQITEGSRQYTQTHTPEPFLFSLTTLTPEDMAWSLDYSASYGERVSGPFGYEGIGQEFALKGYLGSRFTVYANAAFGFPAQGKIVSAQQAEVIRNFIGGKEGRELRLGAGLGLNNDYSNVISLLSCVTATYNASRWEIGGNLLFEKSLAVDRDP